MIKLSLIIIVALSSCVEPIEYGCVDEMRASLKMHYDLNIPEGITPVRFDDHSYTRPTDLVDHAYADEDSRYYRGTKVYKDYVVNFVSHNGDDTCLISYGPRI
jgi:hypothetical protein